MLSWVAGGAIGLIPDDGRVGLTLAVVLIAAAAVRAYLVSRRLRDEILGRPPRNLPDVRRPPSTDAAPVLSGTVSNVSTTEVDDDPPPGFHVYQPTAPDAGVTDPRTGG